MNRLLLFLMVLVLGVNYCQATIELSFNTMKRSNLRCTYAEETGIYTLTASGRNAYVELTPLERDLESSEVRLVFEYSSMGGINNLNLTYGNTFTDARKVIYGTFAATGSDYQEVSFDLTNDICAYNWGSEGQILRFGIGNDDRVKIKNLRLETVTPNVQGKVVCNGVGVSDVVVTDGYAFTRTDADGNYAFRSNKKNGYVFYEIPSGYMPLEKSSTPNVDKIFTRFWKDLTNKKDLNALETVDFELQVENNTDFRMLVSADPQMANRVNDVNTFSTLFFPRSDEEYKDAQAANVPIYSTYMGDLAWDNYWYKNKWGHYEYKNLFAANYSRYKLRHFSVMGNHDHDGAIYNSDSVDFESAHAYRSYMGPNYYSYNIGKVHILVMDNIIYKNEDDGSSYSKGIVGLRNYTTGFSEEQLAWAKTDLAMVDHNTIVVLCMHAPMYKIGSIDQNTVAYGLTRQADMEALLAPFKQVFIWSGHRHLNYNMNPPAHPNIIEHNFNQMGGDLYNSSYYSSFYAKSPQGVGRPVSSDGTPASYQIFYFYGDSVTWRFKGIEQDNNGQFHVFDGNSVRNFWKTDATMKALGAASSSLNTYASLEDNAILINVFNYDPKWKIEVFEGNSTTSLKVSGYLCRPIYHILAYDYCYYKKTGNVPSSITGNHFHTFKAVAKEATTPVTVKVTDRFGNTYERTITRPQTVSLDAFAVGKNTEKVILTGIDEKKANIGSDLNVHAEGAYIMIKTRKAGTAQITSVDGTSRVVNLSVGDNKIPAPQRGVNIVTIDGQSKKLYLK